MSKYDSLLVRLLNPDEADRTGPNTSYSKRFALNLASCTMMSKVQLEQAIDTNTNALKKDLHDQRMKELRKLAKDIEEDAWRYEPVEKLIGLR